MENEQLDGKKLNEPTQSPKSPSNATSTSNVSNAPNIIKMSKDENKSDQNLSPNSSNVSTYKNRIALFEAAVQGPEIKFNNVRELASTGIPDSLRSIYWKILLSYLPNDKKMWPDFLQKNRSLYQTFIKELTVDPHEKIVEDDHPLSTHVSSQWNAFFKDKDTLEEIDKDVKRTLPHLHFFNHDKEIGDTTHYEALKRILFIYAKLNPGIKYVQGMNEILGPIYYIFAKDNNDPDFRDNAEPDTFFCFTHLMSEIRDNFCKTLDKSELGVQGSLDKLSNLIELKDPELSHDFKEKSLNTQFYGFRWITLLLSQEFELPDVLRLWDSLFSDPYRFDLLSYVCLAMLSVERERLLDGSFADNLKLLQNYPVQDVHILLKRAEELRSNEYVAPNPRPKQQQNKQVQNNNLTHRSSQKTSNSNSNSNTSSPLINLASIQSEVKNLEEETLSPVTLLPLRMPEPPKPFLSQTNENETESDGEESSENSTKSDPLS